MKLNIGARYNRVKQKYQDWKKEIVFKTKEDDPLSDKLGKDWSELGYHRTIASFFYYMWMLLPEALFSIALIPLLQYTQYRFPETAGFTFASVGVFAAMYSILDINLKDAIDRFVPEYVIKNPRRAMEYVSFFVKYQMYSGLMQIAIVGLLVPAYLVDTQFAYVAFYMMFESVKQYPATLGLFNGLLGSFQRFNKKTNITILRASFIEPVTKIIGGVIGLAWGLNNPRFGELFGLALGWAIGGYVDDFFTFTAGTYMLSKVLDEYGIKIREIYMMKIPSTVWKSAIGYSARLWPLTIFNSIAGLSGFVIVADFMPGYLTLKGLTKTSEDLATFVSGFSDDILGSSQPAFSEAYNNDKMYLTKYYIASGLKYWTFMFMLLGSINILGLPVILSIAFEGGFLPETWGLISVMVPLYIYIKLLDPFKDVANKMIAVSNHPEINSITGIVITCVNWFSTWYFLAILQMGWIGLILMIVPGKVVEFIIKWIFMYKKIIKLDKEWWKDVAWQLFVAPLLSGSIFILFLVFMLDFLWPIITAGLTGTALLLIGAPIILLVLVGGLFLYMPLYSYLGGWDKNTLRDFKKCIPLTGPSLVVTWPLMKIADKFHEKSPFKTKSHLDIGDKAFEELLELGEIRAKGIKDQK